MFFVQHDIRYCGTSGFRVEFEDFFADLAFFDEKFGSLVGLDFAEGGEISFLGVVVV